MLRRPLPRRILCALLALAAPCTTLADGDIQIAAAASLTDALDAAIEAYEAHHDDHVTPVYASSSTLARQIANGSPAALYISANVDWMDWLEDQGVATRQRHDLLHNRLALISASEALPATFIPGEDGRLATLLGDRERLSVGDPAHVPAGMYAHQALATLGEWDELAPRLARASDVRAALALVERGEAPLGVVYQTDAQASEAVRVLGLLPADSHAPITYPVALIGTAPSEAAVELLTWLESDEAREIFLRYGFSVEPDAS